MKQPKHTNMYPIAIAQILADAAANNLGASNDDEASQTYKCVPNCDVTRILADDG